MGTRAPEAIVRGDVSREVGLEPSQGGVFGKPLMAGHRPERARSPAPWTKESITPPLPLLSSHGRALSCVPGELQGDRKAME